MSTAHVAITSAYPRTPAQALLSPPEEQALFRCIRSAHTDAWLACLAAPGVTDSRAEDPEWRLLLAAQRAATAHAISAQRGAQTGDDVLDAWMLREDVGTTKRRLEVLVDRAVQANLRLCTHIAATKFRRSRLPLEDRLQAAAMGCLRAVRGFDPERGWRFSTYATPWIEHYIQRAAHDTADTIRVPVHMHETRERVAKALTRAQAQQEVPSIAALATASGRPASAVRQALTVPVVVSADAPFDRDRDAKLLDRVADDARAADEALDAHRRAAAVAEGIATLPPRLAAIVRARYLPAGDAETLAEIGARLSLSRERVRQLAAEGVRMLQVVVPKNMSACGSSDTNTTFRRFSVKTA